MKVIVIMTCNQCGTVQIMDPLWVCLDGQDSTDFACDGCDTWDSHIEAYVPKAVFDEALKALKNCRVILEDEYPEHDCRHPDQSGLTQNIEEVDRGSQVDVRFSLWMHELQRRWHDWRD